MERVMKRPRVGVAWAIAGLLLCAVNLHGQTPSWYSTSWAYRKQVTIDHTKVSSTDQTNFPVLVSLTADSKLALHALANGYDLLFTLSDGATKTPYQRELYTNGTLLAWVKVPTLSHTTNTMLYLYYGNPAAADQQDKTSTLGLQLQRCVASGRRSYRSRAPGEGQHLRNQ